MDVIPWGFIVVVIDDELEALLVRTVSANFRLWKGESAVFGSSALVLFSCVVVMVWLEGSLTRGVIDGEAVSA